MKIPANLEKIFQHITQNQKRYIDVLKEAVAIKSVSAWPDSRKDVCNMVEWTKKRLEALGVQCSIHDIGEQTLPDGSKLKLPPVLCGQFGNDSAKKTVCVYGHLDVQPAMKEDGWNTEPFVLTEKDGKLFGRGASDDKGPVIGWIHALEAFQTTGVDVPVNIKFVFEGMEESGSEGLEEFLKGQKETFLKGTDYVCISDNYWLGKNKPCLTYGLRGICYYLIEVEGVDKDLHSGVFGGSVHEAMADLIYLMNTLLDVDGNILIPVESVDKDLHFDVFGGSVHEAMADLIYLMNTLLDAEGNILIPGIMDEVAKVAPDEDKLYESIDFDVEDFRKDIGAPKLIHDKNKKKTLMARWRFPSLSLHGIEGAFSEPGAKTVIPRKVIGKFSIRIVPDQTPESITKCVLDYLNQVWKKRGSPNRMKAQFYHGGECWMADPKHPNFEAGRRATKFVYGVDPDMTREGGSIPITIVLQIIEWEGSAPAWVSDPNHPHFLAGSRATKMVYGVEPDFVREGGSIPITITLQDVTGKNVMLLPMGAADDGAHSQNEKIDIRNYIEGTKLLAAYLHEVAEV